MRLNLYLSQIGPNSNDIITSWREMLLLQIRKILFFGLLPCCLKLFELNTFNCKLEEENRWTEFIIMLQTRSLFAQYGEFWQTRKRSVIARCDLLVTFEIKFV